MIYVKLYDTERGPMLAMCDKDLLGKVLEDGDVTLDLKSYRSFYEGDLVPNDSTADRILVKLKVASANIVGKESIDAAIRSKIIDKGNVKKIKGIPYAQAYLVETGPL